MYKSYLIICLLLASCVSKPAQDSSQHRDFTKAMLPVAKTNNYSDEAIRLKIKKHIQTYADRGEFSGSILVAKGDAILFKGAFGFADIKKKIKNEIDTRYLIGSTTKSFTAIALMRFEEKGLVNLNSPISKYLPNLRKGLADKLTLDILLRMTSGLPNHIKRLASIKKKDITTDGIVKIINTAKLEYDPGTKYSYSNLNYNLIAAVMEKVSGLSYDQILKKEIFDPLNMKNSGTNDFHTLRKRRASGYFVPVMEKVANYNLSYASGSGNIYSTIEDIYKWDQALYDDDFLSKKSKEKAFNGGTKEFGYYAYGFRIRKYQRLNPNMKRGVLVRHGGTMPGYLANVHRYLDDRITVIILGNISIFPIRDLTTELKNLAIGRPVKPNGKAN